MMRHIPLVLLAAFALAACDRESSSEPTIEPSLDAELRPLLSQWGTIPIAEVRARPPALVALGRALFFDPVLSGNRDVSCASCHDPRTHTADRRSLSIGTAGRHTPRNAPALFNAGLGAFTLFWDGRISFDGAPSFFRTPAGNALPAGLDDLVAVQAMFPVTNRIEMRGFAEDRDASGRENELARFADTDFEGIWNGVMARLLAIDEYRALFAAAYPGLAPSQLRFQHAANAISAFQVQSFAKTDSPFDRYLARRDGALSADQKRGALLFFGRARCSSCHSGPLLGGFQFASVGAPQIGPGSGRMLPLDGGREDLFPGIGGQFVFRVPPLRNVELSAPYMHAGAYPTLEAVVRHYNDAERAIRSYDVSQLEPSLRASYHGDAATITALLGALDPRLRAPLQLTDEEQRQLVAFLQSLTDPAARNLAHLVPTRVPSGLTMRRAD